MTERNEVTIRLASPLAEEIEKRTGGAPQDISLAVTRDLLCYYRLLEQGLIGLNLTRAESLLVIYAARGDALSSDGACEAALWAHVVNEIRNNGAADKWSVDGEALLQKVERLGVLTIHALTDLVGQIGAGAQEIDRSRALEVLMTAGVLEPDYEVRKVPVGNLRVGDWLVSRENGAFHYHEVTGKDMDYCYIRCFFGAGRGMPKKIPTDNAPVHLLIRQHT